MDELQKPPRCYVKRCADYKFWWQFSNSIFIILGSASVVCATCATLNDGIPAKLLSGLAAIFTALMGFIKPKRHFLNFKKAWALMDQAIMKYQLQMIELSDLQGALEEAEQLLLDGDSDLSGN